MYDDDRMTATRGYFHTTEAQALRDFAEHHGIQVAYKNELCGSCDGEGSRALHGLVISGEALEDRDFMEDYMGGEYDTRCEDCNGEKVVKVPDLDRMDDATKKAWERWMRDVRRDNAESLSEMRAGC